MTHREPGFASNGGIGESMKKKPTNAQKIQHAIDDIAARVRTPPISLSLRSGLPDQLDESVTYFDDLMQISFHNASDAAEKLRTLATLLVCSHGTLNGPGRIYIGRGRIPPTVPVGKTGAFADVKSKQRIPVDRHMEKGARK